MPIAFWAFINTIGHGHDKLAARNNDLMIVFKIHVHLLQCGIFFLLMYRAFKYKGKGRISKQMLMHLVTGSNYR